MVVIDGTVMKGERIIIPLALWQRALEQLYINHMVIERIRLMARESMYIGLTQLNDNLIPHDIKGKPWETVGADIFMLNKKHTSVL